jgi:hypothetical protein
MSKNGSEPAYPVIGAPGSPEDYPGLSKRELIAAMAMQGLLANPFYAQEMQSCNCSGSTHSAAVYHADQLLAELEKTNDHQ